MVVDSSSLHPESLEANRSGRLTDTQRANLGSYNRSIRKSELTWALLLLALAAIIFFGARSGAPATMHIGIPFLCVLLAVGLVVWSVGGSDPLTRDIRQGKVESVEGAIGKRHISTGGSGTGADVYTHFLDVAGKSFTVAKSTYNASPDAGYVRIYFLPRSHHVVNLERLPDPPVPENITPKDLLGTLGASLRLRDRTQRNEARARAQAMADEIQAEFTRKPDPPTADRDPRPLDQAIVGTWRSMMMTVTFHGDGTVEAALPGNQSRSGSWSVDADGRLRADVMGHSDAAEAWVAGDELTLSLNGMGLSFKRVSDGTPSD